MIGAYSTGGSVHSHCKRPDAAARALGVQCLAQCPMGERSGRDWET
jgi:hypothetical protein